MTMNGTALDDALGGEHPVPPLVADAVALRMHWFEHPALLTTEVTVAEGYAVQIARRRPPA